MCDYSLEHVMSRPAKVGDKLMTTRFAGTITRGFAAVDDPNVAVCLLPGTELAFEQVPEHSHFLAFLRNRKVGADVARFRQVEEHKRFVHHDALEFANGKIVLLTQLAEGQCATVLQLPVDAAQPARPETAEAEKQNAELVTVR